MQRWLESLVQDLGYATRAFRRSPAFTAVALLSLTLGIGATSAIFSVIYGVLIAPYPYARPDEIWAPGVRAVDGRGGHGHTLDEFLRMQKLPAFSDVMATSYDTVLLSGDFTPESFGGVLLSGNAFNFLGVAPVIGRTIQPSDFDRMAARIRWSCSATASGSACFRETTRPSVRRSASTIVPHTIVGVMPPRFGWYGNDTLWLPLAPNRRDVSFVNPIVRLAPGVSPRAAEDQLHVFYQSVAKENPSAFPAQGFTTTLRNYLDVTVASGDMRTTLRLLLGAVAFLLLIACANVANLQLARGTARAREMALRASIGAGRSRLVRQLLTESVSLSILGGAAGVAFAYGAINAIVALMPEFYVPNEARVAINTPVLVFSVALAVFTGIVFGLAPALQQSRPDVVDALKAGRGSGEGTQGGRIRNLLVVVEVALAVVLLVSAALTVRTFIALQRVDVGLQADNVLIVSVPLPAPKYPTLEKRNLFAEELLERMADLPGVEAVSIGNGGAPFGGLQTPFTIAGTEDERTAPGCRQPGGVRPSADLRHVTSGRPHVRRGRGAPRRSDCGDQRSGAALVAGGGGSDRRPVAARRPRTATLPWTRRRRSSARGHSRRHHRRYAQRRIPQRTNTGRAPSLIRSLPLCSVCCRCGQRASPRFS